MTPLLALTVTVLAVVAALALTRAGHALRRFVAGDGAVDLLGHVRRPAAYTLPTSHHDPFPAHPGAFLR